MRLNNLILKPLFQCVCKCKHCNERQKFYTKENKRNLAKISLEKIKKLIREADELGAKKLQLSGGEVLLYPHLKEVISEAKKYGWFVFVNSVGWNVTPQKAESLFKAGLDAFNISLDSSLEQQHDQSRGLKGLYQSSMNTLEIFRKLKQNNSRIFYTNIQIILLRQNYQQLPDLFEIALKKGVDSIYLMYVYDDFKDRFKLNTNEITILKRKIVPKIIKVLEDNNLSKEVISYALKNLNELFETKTNSIKNYERGIYWNKLDYIKKKCKKPKNSLLILPNGNVLPCCGLENSQNVIVGNIYSSNLKKIWTNNNFQNFRKNKSAYCRLCPSFRNKTIGFTSSMLKQF